MKIQIVTITLCCAMLALSGCGSAPTRPADGGAGNGANDEGAVTDGVTVDEAEEGLAVDPNSIAGRAPVARVIYFDFDKSEIRPEFLDIVAQHGRYLAQNTGGRVRLEGHTDERGAREYNIALGEARAKAIARMLQLQGVSSAQTRAVSYGEELPVDEGHNTEAWAKNRRVNIIYEVDVPN